MAGQCSPQTVFILGAGFSKAISDAMPVTSDLGKKLLSDPYILRNRLSEPVANALNNDFESTLTDLSSPKPWRTQESNDYDQAKFFEITECLRHFFETTVFDAIVHWKGDAPESLTALLSFWHANRSTVITLNYDTLVEWAASAFYTTGQQNLQIPTGALYPSGFFPLKSTGPQQGAHFDTFQLLKLHGSINWFYSGSKDFSSEGLYFQGYTGGATGPYMPSYELVERRNSLSRAGRKPLIIPPAQDKSKFLQHDSLRNIWFLAAQALREADRIVCIGYSLPPSDGGMVSFLKEVCGGKHIALEIVDLSQKTAHFEDVLGKDLFQLSQRFAGESAVASFCGTLENC